MNLMIPWTQLKGFFLFPVFKIKLNFLQTIYKLQFFYNYDIQRRSNKVIYVCIYLLFK